MRAHDSFFLTDKHHDKAYGIDNQERGVRVNSKGKHGHNKGHDDLVKSKEHYSHGVHDSSHNEKLFANSKSTLGAGYPVKGPALYQRGPRDHLSSSTDKVTELEEGNATNAHSNGDTTGKKKVIRIRVITKRPEVASVFIKGQVANGSPGSVDSYVHAGYSDAQPDEYYAPSKDKQPKDSSDQSIENVSNDPSAGPALPSKKHFVPMEVLASFYGNIHGKSPSEDTNAKNLPVHADNTQASSQWFRSC
ncbi:hypothetical protein HPB48_011749 [Haemaphysalis longicornis]|uniref:Uncharacterized protein n=1 Tax=Haemaphysalis longicornis TaxID=44386 RepID=A0A9J6H2U5_HAELO|nr:hypothetical protein HPB48_011749 [Haemaphysalis longicornis]